MIFLFLCLPLLLFSENFSKGPPSSWVKECDFTMEPPPIKPSQVNLQHLLIDVQRNWEEKTVYAHYAVKVLTAAGIQKMAQVRLNFDPAYQQLMIHSIRIYRDGKWLDRLENSRHHLIQREANLDDNLYNGDLTVVYFLNDIRLGDVLEYAYSKMGHHPIFSSHYTDIFYFQSESVIEKISRRLLIHPDRSFSIRPFHASIQPRISDLTPTLQEWTWEAYQTPPCPSEPLQPSWYNPYARIQNSQHDTWQEVVKIYFPIYALPPEFASPEMMSLIEKWKEESDDPAQRALTALRFVQDEVRYQGLEEGIGDTKPADPSTVLQRRFGDCKDKTVLLAALLQLMDIKSAPLLVNTNFGKRLPEFLPAPRIFDHAILQLEIDNTSYCVDPTLRLQGGTLKDNFLPDYYWGLLISPETTDLTPIPHQTLKKPLEIEASLTLTSQLSASYKIHWTFSGCKADNMRRRLAWEGLKKLTEDHLATTQEYYKGASSLFPLTVTDDRRQNIFTLTGSYRISTRSRLGKKVLKVSSIILDRYLARRISLERSAPYALEYPLWVKEHIHIDNPYNDWHLESEEASLPHESILYNYSMKKENQTADFHFELKHLKDHVPVDAIQDYWNITTEIEPNPSLELTIALPSKRVLSN